MGTVLSYFEHKRRAPGGRARHIDPVIAEILEALLALGGSAHRQAVADQVALRRGGRSSSPDTAVRDELYAAFDAYLTAGKSRKALPLLWLPLGPGSYRWALTDVGLNLLQPAPQALRMVP